jgi:hypothetical protein
MFAHPETFHLKKKILNQSCQRAGYRLSLRRREKEYCEENRNEVGLC